jgi:hypothetical protein
VTPWLVRLAFPGVVPHDDTVTLLASAAGLCVTRVTGNDEGLRWLLAGGQPREEVDTAVARLSHTHRIRAAAWRRLAGVQNIS